MMFRSIFLILFLLLPYYLLAQNNFTVHGELPDNSLDGKYVYMGIPRLSLAENGPLIDSVLVVNSEFQYTGSVDDPFLAGLSLRADYFGKFTFFIVEPGHIKIKITDWQQTGNVSGTPINEDYNLMVVEPTNLAEKIRQPWDVRRKEGFDNRTWTEDEEWEYMDSAILNVESEWARSGKIRFMEKYVGYPHVIRFLLWNHIQSASQQAKVQHILDKLPEAVRDTLYVRQAQQIQLVEKYRTSYLPEEIYLPVEVIPDH
ncbi:MAG: DUF4369 domain-containing protein, partial [Rikenellaceae bacterium]|nr:DUF4369 domain-containing protein [Rikenellaceae bacterium]